jgi:hypothetical protein
MASIVVRVCSCSLLSLALLTAACGDDGSPGDGTEASTSAASTSSSTTASTPDPSTGTASTGTPEPTSSSSSSTEGADTSTGSTEGSTGTSTDTSTGSTEGSTGTSTGGQGNVVYSAVAVPGGLDRIRINKANLDDDRCTWVILVAPSIPGMYPGMTIPAGWSVESISINDVAAACGSDNPAMFGSEPATDANGTIGFGMLGGTGIYPCTVDIDATFDFAGILPGIPPTDDMIATDVPVTGC